MGTKKSKSAGVMAYGMDRDWRTESDLSTLQAAEAIERDPKRFKAAQELAKKKLVELGCIAGADGKDKT
jgi:hypothetical protein